MDGFSGYNQIHIKPEDQNKMTFICPWGTFAYQKIHFGLKNTGATFQWEITTACHDIKRIIEVYLDDLASHSCLRVDRSNNLWLVFKRCHRYQIWLNPQKCLFYMRVGLLL